MKLTGVHFLLTYQCLYECDHCFVWGGPRQTGTMTTEIVDRVLSQSDDLGTVEWVYFEGGEPFLYYSALLACVRKAAARGYRVGLVSNAYWATDPTDAFLCLEPFQGLVEDLSISTDLYHGDELVSPQAVHAVEAAKRLGIDASTITIAQADDGAAAASRGQLPTGASAVMFRGRAAEKLAGKTGGAPWSGFDRCPHEELRDPDRLHVDPLGYLHVCQGISVGNVFERSLEEICGSYDPESHPIVGPLLRGGPAELVREHVLPHAERYADACHLCYEARSALRHKHEGILAPDQVYGVTPNDDGTPETP
jgi:MoaA/NifB/PqqE/SkfB family radical SAM enzyme